MKDELPVHVILVASDYTKIKTSERESGPTAGTHY